MKILVTGGAGYIGSHMVKMLCELEHSVIVVDSLVNGHRQAVDKRARFVEACLSDKKAVAKALKGCDAAMHFAGFSEAHISMDEPEKFFENNVYYGILLLEAMKESGVNNIIFSSTGAVYGNPKYTPIDEKHPKEPKNFYGQTKLFFEQLLRWYEVIYGIKSVSLRYFNAAGADESGKIGESHNPETHIIPLVLKVALKQEKCVRIFGIDYNTKDGTCIRDYIHVNDLCKAHILALEYLLKHKKSECFNLGTGVGTSVREIIAECERVTGKNIKTVEYEKRKGDVEVLVSSAEKVRRVLGWKPKYKDVSKIIKTAWQWHSKYPHGYGTKIDRE